MLKSTVGQLLVNEILPPEYRDYNRVIGSDEMEQVLAGIAKSHPEQYRDISAKLMRLGNRGSVDGGVTLRLSDTLPTFDRSVIYNMMDAQEDKIRKDRSLSDAEKRTLIDDMYTRMTNLMFDNAYDTALKNKNPFALQVKSKARGNKAQLGAMIASPGVYTDTKGNPVPMFIRHSYADGLSPAEMWAGSYGARNGVVGGKLMTRKGGELGKLMASLAIDQVVTESDCGSPYGLPVSATDKDNIGCVLAYDAGGHKAGEVINKATIQDFVKHNVKDIAVRSPVTCQAKHGVCAHCCGVRESGKFPELGYNLGVTAASALSERIAQAALSCLVEGTLVIMASGEKRRIEDVRPGEYVLGSDLNGRIAPTRVVDVYDNGWQPCYRTTFVRNGCHKGMDDLVLESTIIHKILGTRRVSMQKDAALNWKPRVLPVGTVSKNFYAYTSSSFDDTGYMHEQLAMLIGALLGDGCYTKSVNGVHLSSSDPEEVSDIQKTLEGLDLHINKLKYHNGIYYRVSQSRPRGGKNLIKNWLKQHGMYGKLAHEKEIPAVAYTWDNASVAALLGGIIATDGSVHPADKSGKPCISLTLTSKKLVEQFRELARLRFGVVGTSITRAKKAGHSDCTHDQWKVSYTKPDEVARLYECLSIPGLKKHKLKSMLDAWHGNRTHARVVFRRIEQLPIGDRHVYDLEVECKDHIFLLANGLIVSNTKHSGRLTKGTGQYQGFDMIKALTTVPKSYPDKASVAPKDGTVDKIEKAPQGGEYITVGGERTYVPPGYDVLVKQGDEVEAGDQLSDGVLDPKDVVKYKGVGEGRRYFTNRFTQALRDSSYKANRRNVEAIARALVDHVQIEDEDSEGQMLPGDVTTYTNWAFGYKPRPDSVVGSAKSLIGKYLEQPALHYTIGTRITKNVAKELDKFGRGQNIIANANPVNVTPVMQSIVKSTGTDKDWMTRLGTTYLKSRLLEDAQHGSTSDIHSTSPIPGLAKGVEFGNYFDVGVKRPGGYTY